MKIFLDTNILLDIFLERGDFLEDALSILQLGIDKNVELSASPLTFATCHYILQKERNKREATEILRALKPFVTMTTMDEAQGCKALYSNMPDFEDMLQLESAFAANCDMIITRNKKHFPKEPVTVLTPSEFWEFYGS
ncbi:MAG: PIN domain-containing protein [Aeriscardovia sp.]|nr:PIN domain-containing protein [Aeriscardovia sp.]